MGLLWYSSTSQFEVLSQFLFKMVVIFQMAQSKFYTWIKKYLPRNIHFLVSIEIIEKHCVKTRVYRKNTFLVVYLLSYIKTHVVFCLFV
jgi:hypothetical protein